MESRCENRLHGPEVSFVEELRTELITAEAELLRERERTKELAAEIERLRTLINFLDEQDEGRSESSEENARQTSSKKRPLANIRAESFTQDSAEVGDEAKPDASAKKFKKLKSEEVLKSTSKDVTLDDEDDESSTGFGTKTEHYLKIASKVASAMFAQNSARFILKMRNRSIGVMLQTLSEPIQGLSLDSRIVKHTCTILQRGTTVIEVLVFLIRNPKHVAGLQELLKGKSPRQIDVICDVLRNPKKLNSIAKCFQGAICLWVPHSKLAEFIATHIESIERLQGSVLKSLGRFLVLWIKEDGGRELTDVIIKNLYRRALDGEE